MSRCDMARVVCPADSCASRGHRRHFSVAEAGLHRQRDHDAIPRWVAVGDQIPQHGPLLVRTDTLSLLALHDAPPVGGGSQLVRYLLVAKRMLPVWPCVKPN